MEPTQKRMTLETHFNLDTMSVIDLKKYTRELETLVASSLVDLANGYHLHSPEDTRRFVVLCLDNFSREISDDIKTCQTRVTESQS